MKDQDQGEVADRADDLSIGETSGLSSSASTTPSTSDAPSKKRRKNKEVATAAGAVANKPKAVETSSTAKTPHEKRVARRDLVGKSTVALSDIHKELTRQLN